MAVIMLKNFYGIGPRLLRFNYFTYKMLLAFKIKEKFTRFGS